jgi:DNA-binding LytR/AlgR family response regulator
MPLKVLIVDDEYPARQELSCIFEEIGNIEVVAECHSGEEAYRTLQEATVDAVFLDIQMRTMDDGLIAAEKIMKLPRKPKIVFTTGFSQFAVQAFELEAVDYVLKPYSRERLELTVERLTREEKAIAPPSFSDPGRPPEQVRISVWHNDRLLVLLPSEIFFVGAEQKRKTLLCTEKGDFTTTMSLKAVQERLANCGFLRTHKSFLVNMSKVREIVPWFNDTYILSLEGCSVKDIPVAKHFMQEFKRAMGI